MNPPESRPARGALAAALLMSLAFLAVTSLQKFSDMSSLLFRTPIIDTVVAGSIWGTKLGVNLVLFGLAVLFLHVLFALAGWGLGRASVVAWPRVVASLRQWVLGWMLLGILATAAASAGLYHNSALAKNYGHLARGIVAGVPVYALLGVVALALAAATLLVALWRSSRAAQSASSAVQRRKPLWLIAVAAPVVVAAAVGLPEPQSAPAASNVVSRPNVIYIGIDSLRADMAPLDASSPYTPELNRFLSGATRFADAVTPLARTFPSWVSLLTGRHPHTTGAYMNLLPRDLVDTQDTIADTLRAHGYRTLYAVDEVRFSNVDESYGFDQRISPPIGATEFIIAFFADLPLLNLTVNTRAGEWLFPHLHGNRGASMLYDPDVFVAQLERGIDPVRPMFLALHLTTSHWPYHWRDYARRLELDKPMPDYYVNALRRVDQQFGDIWRMLERKGLLEDAIVVVFSDHGEAFGVAQESLVPIDSAEIVRLGAKPTWGHGTSVLSPHQYRVVLAMRRVGRGAPSGAAGLHVVHEPTTLEDVTPTITDLLGIAPRRPYDGESLRAFLEPGGAPPDFSERVRFTETEYTPVNLATLSGAINPSAAAAVTRRYRVDPETDRVELRKEAAPQMRRQRQFAAIGSNRLMAAVPSQLDGRFLRLLVPLAGGLPQRVETQPDPALDPEAARLWQALQDRYGGILTRGLGGAGGPPASQSDAARHAVTLAGGSGVAPHEFNTQQDQ
jgi:arylsulfatase A-like enzyme